MTHKLLNFAQVEIVADERPKLDKGRNQRGYLAARAKTVVAVQIGINETGLRAKIKAGGGRWSVQHKIWLITYEKAISLGVKTRIIAGAAEKCPDVDISLIT